MKTPMTKLMLAAFAATLLCLGARAEFTLDDGLVAYYKFDGDIADSVGTAVTDGQIKVYAADSVEGLEDAEPVSEGVTVTERKSAVKTTIEVVLPSTPEKQFFKVKFGE